jgi:leucyl aminopeptidase
MRLALYTDDLLEVTADLLAVGVFSDEPDRGLAFSQLNRALDGALERACRDEDFKGRPGQTVVFNTSGDAVRARRVLVAGYGERDKYDAEAARRFAGTAARVARTVNAASLAVVLTVREQDVATSRRMGSRASAAADGSSSDLRTVDLVQALSEGVTLGSYVFSSLVR